VHWSVSCEAKALSTPRCIGDQDCIQLLSVNIVLFNDYFMNCNHNLTYNMHTASVTVSIAVTSKILRQNKLYHSY